MVDSRKCSPPPLYWVCTVVAPMHVACANCRHLGTHYSSRDFKKEYPDAKLIGVRPLLNKRKDLPWDGGTGMIYEQSR